MGKNYIGDYIKIILSPSRHSLCLPRDGLPNKIWIVSNTFRWKGKCDLLNTKKKSTQKPLRTVTIIYRVFSFTWTGCHTRVKEQSLAYYLLNLRENISNHTFLKSSSSMWNADGFVQDLNLGSWIHFLRR